MTGRKWLNCFSRRLTALILAFMMSFQPVLSVAAPLLALEASETEALDSLLSFPEEVSDSSKIPFEPYFEKPGGGFGLLTLSGTQVGGTISQDTTWTAANSPYVVISSITVSSGKRLTIEPGVVVKFQSQLSLIVNGTLLADGTSTTTVVFTSIKDDSYAGDTNGDSTATVPAKGDWSQISFASSSTNSVIDNGVVKYGGYVTSGKYGVISALCPALTLTNTTMESNNSYAVYAGTNTNLTNSGNQASDNTRNGFYVQAGTTTSNTRWQSDALPYVVSSFTVGQNKTHRVDAGALVKFEASGELTVNGAFSATGTVEQQVVFTSVKDDSLAGDTNNDGTSTVPAKGNWRYIKFNDQSIDASSKIERARIRFGGSLYGSVYIYSASPSILNSIIEDISFAGIYLLNNSQPTIAGNLLQRNQNGIYAGNTTGSLTISTNTIKESTSASDSGGVYLNNVSSATVTENTITANKHGVYATGSSQASLNSNTISGNLLYPAVMANNSLLTLSSNVTSGNAYNAIGLAGVRSAGATLAKQELVYGVDAFTIAEATTVSVEPGTIFKFEDQSSVLVASGTLLAQGTPEEQIVFTSMKDDQHGGDTNGDGTATAPAPGDWFYIDVRTRPGTTRIENALVIYGGYGSSTTSYAALQVHDSSPTISNSTFSQSQNSGIYVFGQGSGPTIIESTFTTNGAGISLTNGPSGAIIESTITGNSGIGVFTSASSVFLFGNLIADNSIFGLKNLSEPQWSNPTLFFNEFSGHQWYDVYNSSTREIEAIGNSWANREFQVGDILTGDETGTPAAYSYDVTVTELGRLVTHLRVNWGSFPVGPDAGRVFGADTFSGYFGDVNSATGNYSTTFQDIAIPGRGLAIDFSRTYNSLDSSHTGQFGYGWTHSYEQALFFHGDGSITVLVGNGKRQTYTRNSDGTYSPPKGVYETLTRNADRSYTVKQKNQTRRNFTSSGRLNSIVDKNGNQIIFSYNSYNELTVITDSVGRTLNLAYDSKHRIKKITDPAGRSLDYTYNANGNLTAFTDAKGGTTTYAYSSRSITSVTNPRGYASVQNTYDSRNRIATQKDALNNTTTFSYSDTNTLTTITDPRGNLTRHYYDSEYRLTKETDALGFNVLYTYDSTGNVESTTDGRGYTTRYAYDSRGNLLVETDTANNITTFTYDANNNLLTKTDPLNHKTTNSYDVNSNLLTTSNALEETTTMSYDAYGELLTKTDASGHTARFGYDAHGNLTSIADALENTTTIAYDSVGRKISATDPEGHTTYYAYDSNDNLITVTDARNGVTRYTYDPNDNLLTVRDVREETTTNTYNAADRLTKVTDQLGNETSYTYDGNYNKTSVTDANGETTNYGYDVVNELTLIDYPDTSTVGYTYDANGNRLSVTDSTGTTSYSYDARNLLTQVAYPGGKTVSYGYDDAGRKISMTLNGTGTTEYGYDSANRLTSVTDPWDNLTSYEYDQVGNRTAQHYPNGAVASFTYDAANRLTLLENKTSTNTVISRYAYEYNADGNKTQVTEKDGSTIAYSYDELHRLTFEVKKDPSNNTIYSYSYTYDPNGNRLTKTDEDSQTTSYTYDAANRLQSAGDVTYSFDDNGNLTRKTQDSSTTTYSYDFEDRLVTITYPDSSTATMIYDADDRRIGSTSKTGETTRYIFDGGNVIQETDGSGSLVANYIVEPEELMGNIIARRDSSGSISFYHYSALSNAEGNVTNLTDINQAVAASYVYEAFGNLLASTETVENSYKFSTKNLDEDSGLYYFGARYYDPETGRFITKDPVEGTLNNPKSQNPYAYAENNPVNAVDPDGRVALVDDLVFVLLLGGLTLSLWLASPQGKQAVCDLVRETGWSISKVAQNVKSAIVYAQNKRHAQDVIAGLQARVTEHKHKIQKDPDNPYRKNWETEIKAFQDRINKLKARWNIK